MAKKKLNYSQSIAELEDILEENPIDGKVINRQDISFYKDFNPTKNIFGELNH